MRVATSILMAAMLAATVAPAQAGVTFDYVGNPYTTTEYLVADQGIVQYFTPPIETNILGDHLTASVTFGDMVTDDFTGTASNSSSGVVTD